MESTTSAPLYCAHCKRNLRYSKPPFVAGGEDKTFCSDTCKERYNSNNSSSRSVKTNLRD